MRGRTLLSLAASFLAACSDGGNDTAADGVAAGSGGSDAPYADPPSPAQSQSFGRGTVPMKITVMVDGKTYRSRGMGECASSAAASIYDVPATLWHAIYESEAEPRRLNLTVWRPKSGGADMAGLSLQIGDATHQIATVKGGRLAGSGVAGVQPAGAGGVLTLTGKDDHGDAIELSVSCARFDEVVAEGG
jgi:hypothetical protein